MVLHSVMIPVIKPEVASTQTENAEIIAWGSNIQMSILFPNKVVGYSTSTNSDNYSRFIQVSFTVELKE